MSLLWGACSRRCGPHIHQNLQQQQQLVQRARLHLHLIEIHAAAKAQSCSSLGALGCSPAVVGSRCSVFVAFVAVALPQSAYNTLILREVTFSGNFALITISRWWDNVVIDCGFAATNGLVVSFPPQTSRDMPQTSVWRCRSAVACRICTHSR